MADEDKNQEELIQAEKENDTNERDEKEDNRGGALMSPEAFIMMSVAMILDFAGFLEFIPFIGSVISFISDVVGIIIIGGWILVRSGSFSMPQKTGSRAAEVAKRLKWFRPFAIIGEYIPGFGILPLWTLLVYFELKT